MLQAQIGKSEEANKAFSAAVQVSIISRCQPNFEFSRQKVDVK